MMKVEREHSLCVDCMVAAVNGDMTGVESDEHVERIRAGLARLGAHLVPDFDAETGRGIDDSARPCDCCGDRSWGERYAFATLVPVGGKHATTHF